MVSHLDVDIQVAFKDWYSGLSAYQKEVVGYTFHNNDSKPLVKLTGYANIRELLFKSLPEAYGLGSLESWSTNEADRLAQRIQNGKTHIEHNAPKDDLDVTFPGNQPSNGKVIYKGEA